MRRFVLTAIAMTVLAACQAGVTPLSDEDIRALEDGVNEHQEALVASDFDVLRDQHTDDVVVWPQAGPTIEGIEGAITSYEESPAPQNASVTSIEIEGYGDFAVIRYTWSQDYLNAGYDEPVPISGRSVIIMRKEEDGTWRAELAMWNSDAPLPESGGD